MSKKKDPFRVLVVDDDADIRDLLKDILEREGYSVETAESGEAALHTIDSLAGLYNRSGVDVVVSDVQMPNGDGVHLLRGITHRFRPFDRPKVYFLSGGSKYSHRDLINLGADAVWDKPLRADILITQLAQAALAKSRRKRFVAHLFVEIQSEFGKDSIRKAMTLNIAPGGMCLVTGHSGFVPGTNIEFSIAHGENVLRGAGTVRWSNNIGQAHHTGIEFVPDEKEKLRPFENLIKEIQADELF